MVDKISAKKISKILNAGIAIQDLASSEDVKGLDILHLIKEEEYKTLERVIMRIKYNIGGSVVGEEFT